MIYFILNAIAGGGKGAEAKKVLETALLEYSGRYEIHETEYPKHAIKLASELTALPDCDGIVAIGGDGTFSEVLNGMDISKPLGLIPCGTGNDFAHGAGIGNDIASSLKSIFDGNTAPIDYIQVGDRRCLNITGTGFDVDILAREARYRKKWKSKLTYYAALLVSILSIKFRRVHLKIDDSIVIDTDMLIMVAANGKYFGGGMPMVPSAITNDGFMDVLLVNRLPWYAIPKLLLCFLNGKIESQKKYVSVYHCKKVECKVENSNDIEMDGEVSQSLPATIEIRTNELRLFVKEKQ